MPLTAKQTEAVAMLIEDRPREDIASELGISPRTLYNWTKDQEFLRVWTREVDGLARVCMKELKTRGVDIAVQTLLEAMACETAGWSDRIRAAERVLFYCGLKPAERTEVDVSGVIEQRMSIDQAHAIVAQAQRVNLKLLPELPDIEVKSGT